MSGKVVGGLIVIISLIAGVALYYLQVYHFYEEVAAPQPIQLTSIATEEPEEIIADDIKAIDASSSPIRFRACFTTPMSQAMLTETYMPYDDAVPLTAPDWFDCFDADEIGEGLETGEALAFLGNKNINYGIDRVVVIFDGGRGFVWHQLNNCGQRAYDGSPAGPECPERDLESE